MHLHFDISSCVRATSKSSECTKCVDICPVSTIKFVDNIPAFTPSECINCGGCVGVCPTNSFSFANFSTIDFFFNFIESKKTDLICQVDMPCLSIFSVEELISLALASEETLTLYAKSCQCGGKNNTLSKQIEANIEEANYILSSFSTKQLLNKKLEEEIEAEEKNLDRRSFFSLKTALKSKKTFENVVSSDELKAFSLDEESIVKLKDKKVPDSRKLLYSLFKRQTPPQKFEVLSSEDVSFISQKKIDESCTNCQICYRICPSGALSSNAKFSVINFDAMLCLKCNLCHDVCETNSIHITQGFNTKEFFQPSKKQLTTFDVRRCDECGNHFTYTGGEVMCKRCQIEEDEALTLQGVK